MCVFHHVISNIGSITGFFIIINTSQNGSYGIALCLYKQTSLFYLNLVPRLRVTRTTPPLFPYSFRVGTGLALSLRFFQVPLTISVHYIHSSAERQSWSTLQSTFRRSLRNVDQFSVKFWQIPLLHKCLTLTVATAAPSTGGLGCWPCGQSPWRLLLQIRNNQTCNSNNLQLGSKRGSNKPSRYNGGRIQQGLDANHNLTSSALVN